MASVHTVPVGWTWVFATLAGLFLGFVVYAFAFCGVSNTCYRFGSDGKKSWRGLKSLFTEGFKAPWRIFSVPMEARGAYARVAVFSFTNPYLSIIVFLTLALVGNAIYLAATKTGRENARREVDDDEADSASPKLTKCVRRR